MNPLLFDYHDHPGSGAVWGHTFLLQKYKIGRCSAPTNVVPWNRVNDDVDVGCVIVTPIVAEGRLFPLIAFIGKKDGEKTVSVHCEQSALGLLVHTPDFVEVKHFVELSDFTQKIMFLHFLLQVLEEKALRSFDGQADDIVNEALERLSVPNLDLMFENVHTEAFMCQTAVHECLNEFHRKAMDAANLLIGSLELGYSKLVQEVSSFLSIDAMSAISFGLLFTLNGNDDSSAVHSWISVFQELFLANEALLQVETKRTSVKVRIYLSSFRQTLAGLDKGSDRFKGLSSIVELRKAAELIKPQPRLLKCACDTFLFVRPTTIEGFLSALRCINRFGIGQFFNNTNAEDFLKRAIDIGDPALNRSLLDAGANPNSVIHQTDENASVIAYACTKWLELTAAENFESAQCIERIIQDLQDYGADLGIIARSERKKQLQDVINRAWERRFESLMAERLAAQEDKLREEFGKDATRLRDKVETLEQKLNTVSQRFWDHCEGEAVNNDILRRAAMLLAEKLLEDSDMLSLSLPPEGNVTVTPELKCCNGHDIFLHPIGSCPSWICDCVKHVGNNKFDRSDRVFGCRTMETCNWNMCETCYKSALLRHKCYVGLTAFCQLLQSGLRVTLVSLVASAGGNVDPSVAGKSLLHALAAQVPFVGEFLKAGLQDLARVQKMAGNKHLIDLFMSNDTQAQDRVISDYAARVTAFACVQIFIPDEEIGIRKDEDVADENETLVEIQNSALHEAADIGLSAGRNFLSSLSWKQAWRQIKRDSRKAARKGCHNIVSLIFAFVEPIVSSYLLKVRTSPDIQEHFHALVAKYVSSFLSFLADDTSPILEAEKLGVKAAEHVLPAYSAFKNFPDILDWRSPKNLFYAVEMCHLASSGRENILFTLLSKWKAKNATIIQANSANSLVCAEFQNHLYLVFNCPDSLSMWVSAMAGVSSRVSVNLNGTNEQVLVDQSVFANASELLRGLFDVDLPTTTSGDREVPKNTPPLVAALLKMQWSLETISTGSKGKKVVSECVLDWLRDSSKRVTLLGFGRGGALAGLAHIILANDLFQNCKGDEFKMFASRLQLITFASFPWCDPSSRESLTMRNWELLRQGAGVCNVLSMGDCIIAANQQIAGLAVPGPFGYVENDRLHLRRVKLALHPASKIAENIAQFLHSIPRLLVLSSSEWINEALRTPLERIHSLNCYSGVLRRIDVVVLDDYEIGDQEGAEMDDFSAEHGNIVISLDEIKDKPPTTVADTKLLEAILQHILEERTKKSPGYSIPSKESAKIELIEEIEIFPESLGGLELPSCEASATSTFNVDTVNDETILEQLLSCVITNNFELARELVWRLGNANFSTSVGINDVVFEMCARNRVELLHDVFVAFGVINCPERPAVRAVEELTLHVSDKAKLAQDSLHLGDIFSFFPSELHDAVLFGGAFIVPILRGFYDVVRLLLQHPLLLSYLKAPEIILNCTLFAAQSYDDIFDLLTCSSILQPILLRRPYFYTLAAYRGKIGVVDSILKSDLLDVNMKDREGDTMFLAAAKTGKVEVMRKIVELRGNLVYASTTDSHGKSALWHAAGGGHLDTVRFLLESDLKIDVNFVNGQNGTALTNAINEFEIEVVKYLLSRPGIVYDFSCIYDNKGAIFLAVVDTLLFPILTSTPEDYDPFLGLEVNRQCATGEALLHAACIMNNSDIISLLLGRHDINPNLRTNDGHPPILFALKDEKSFCLMAQNANVDLNFVLNDDDTLLHYAVHVGNLAVVKALLDNDRFHLKDEMIGVVAMTDDCELLRIFLRRHTMDVHSPLERLLAFCCRSDKPLLNICNWLLDINDVDPNAVTGLYPPLLIAVHSQNFAEVFEALVCCPRVDVNVRSTVRIDDRDESVTCSDLIMLRGDHKRFSLLLEKASERIDLSKTLLKVKPLPFALRSDDNRLLEMVLRHPTLSDEDVNGPYSLDETFSGYCIHGAIAQAHSMGVRLMLSRSGLDLNKHVTIDNVERNTVLHLATLLRNEIAGAEILQMLLCDSRIAPSIDELNAKGMTALCYACLAGSVWALKLLIRHGASVSKSGEETNSPIITCIQSKNNETFDILLSNIDDVDSVSGLLNIAIAHNNTYVVDMLLSRSDFKFTSGSPSFNEILVSLSSFSTFDERRARMFANQDIHPLYAAVLAKNRAAVDVILDYLGGLVPFEVSNAACQMASKLRYSGIVGCFVARGLLTSQQEDSYIESSTENAFDKANLYYAKALSHIDRNFFRDAENTLKLCISACPFDFQTTSWYISLILYRDRGILDIIRDEDIGSLYLVPDVGEPSFRLFVRAMLFYHSERFLDALQVLDRMVQPSALRLGVVALKTLVLIRVRHYGEAWKGYRLLETLRQSSENHEPSLTNYFTISQYILGLLLFYLGSFRESYKILHGISVNDRRFIEPVVICAEIAYSAGLTSACDRKVTQIIGRMSVLPLIERNALLSLQDRLSFDKYLTDQRRAEVEYQKRGKELDEKLRQLLSLDSPRNMCGERATEEILKRWPLSYVQSCVVDLLNKWSQSLVHREWDICFHTVEDLAELIDAEKLVPLQSQWDRFKSSLTTLPPHKRRQSANLLPQDLSLKDDHQAVSQISSDIATLRRIRASIPPQREAVRETIRNLEKLTQISGSTATLGVNGELEVHRREKDLRLHWEELCCLEESFWTVNAALVYLMNCAECFFSLYGADSDYRRQFDSHGEYWLDLARKVRRKQLVFLLQEPCLLAPKALIGLNIQKLPSENGQLMFLKGYNVDNCSIREGKEVEKEREQRLKSNLYEWFVFYKMHQSSRSACAHYVFFHDDVFYKLAPYAPGIEFAVNSLSRLLLEELAIPTRLLRMEGFSLPTWGRVAYYQASLSVPGCTFDKLLAKNPDYIKLIDIRSFSALFLCSLLVGTGDCKPDNLIAQVVVDENKKIECIKLIDIDKDISFCSGRLGFRKLSSTAGKLYSDFLNTLFFLPQMDQPVHSHVREVLTNGKFPIEEIVATWLGDLFRQNQEYEQLVDLGAFTHYDMSKLKLPIKLRKCLRQTMNNGDEIYDPGTAVAIYERLLRVQVMFLEEREVTHSLLLREFYPSIATYYEAKRVELQRKSSEQNIIESIKQLYLEACDDAGLKKDLKFKDRLRSASAWQTISSRKMLDETRFKDRFNGSIADIAEEFIGSINFSRFDADISLLGALLLRNLGTLDTFRLNGMRCSPGRDQFSAFFECLREDSKFRIDRTELRLQKIELCDFVEADLDYCKNTTMFDTLKRMNISVIFNTRMAGSAKDVYQANVEPTLGVGDLQPHQFLAGVNDPKKEKELKMALVRILEHADNFEQLNLSVVSQKIQGLMLLVQDPDIKNMTFLSRVSSDDAVLGDGVEQLESLMFQFSMLMLDFPFLSNVGLAMAIKGAFSNNRRLLVQMIHHRDANKFVPIIARVIQMSPAMLSEVDENLTRVWDEIYASTVLRDDVKERLYCLLINTHGLYLANEFVGAHEYDDDGQRARTLVNETRLLSESTLEKLCRKRNLSYPQEAKKIELLCFVPAFGFPVSLVDWRNGAFDFSRVCCAQCGLTLLHRLALSRDLQPFHRVSHPSFPLLEQTIPDSHSDDNFCRVRFSDAVVQLMYSRVRAVLVECFRDQFTDQRWLDSCIWAPALVCTGDLRSLALQNYRADIIQDIYEHWQGSIRHPKTIFPPIDLADNHRICIGECTLIASNNGVLLDGFDKLRLLSRLFYVVNWEFTIQDAWLFEIPDRCSSVDDCLRRIRELLNSRVKAPTGNSLLYEMVVTPQSRFHSTFGDERTKAKCIQEVLLMGANPLFTRRKNNKTALDAARENNSSQEIVDLLHMYVSHNDCF